MTIGSDDLAAGTRIKQIVEVIDDRAREPKLTKLLKVRETEAMAAIECSKVCMVPFELLQKIRKVARAKLCYRVLYLLFDHWQANLCYRVLYLLFDHWFCSRNFLFYCFRNITAIERTESSSSFCTKKRRRGLRATSRGPAGPAPASTATRAKRPGEQILRQGPVCHHSSVK